MNETLNLFSALVEGFLFGAIFFAGLWWTVRRGLHPKDRHFGS